MKIIRLSRMKICDKLHFPKSKSMILNLMIVDTTSAMLKIV